MIEVIETVKVPRCQVRYAGEFKGWHGLQCDHFGEHFGMHQHALSSAECIRWPSEDDIEDARATAEIEAMTDEQVMATLTDEKEGITRETVGQWTKGAATFAKAMLRANKRIGELEAALLSGIAKLHDHRCPAAGPCGHCNEAAHLQKVRNDDE